MTETHFGPECSEKMCDMQFEKKRRDGNTEEKIFWVPTIEQFK